MDHITTSFFTLKPALMWMEGVMGLEHYWTVEFHTQNVKKGHFSGSGLKSVVMWDPGSGIKFANNEPMAPFYKSSQICLFCEDHHGAGIQHVALTVRDLVAAVRQLQVRCGFIAFEVARRLKMLGRPVAMVALIDVAHVLAVPKSLTRSRIKRFSSALKRDRDMRPKERARRLLRESSRRVRNLLAYELRARLAKTRNQVKMRLYRAYLDMGWELPPMLADIPVRVVLRFAEKEYVLPKPCHGEVLLFRATKKSPTFDGTLIDDTPYVDLFEEPHLGWEGKTTGGVIPFDIAAGHSSMLQEPHVGVIASAMQSYIDAALGDVRVRTP